MQPDQGNAHQRRDAGIDLFRGMLVVLVILGHFCEITQRQSFLTWLGVGFRMPLFLGLTGYLFNLERARAMSVPALGKAYYARLVFPWLIACVVYLVSIRQLDWATPLTILVRPPFHLWFVPVMLAFILAARTCRLSPTAMLAIAAPLSIAAMYLFGVGHDVHYLAPWIPDRRYFTFPIFFALGLWTARQPLPAAKPGVLLLIAAGGLLWWCWLYDHAAGCAEVAAELILCVPLIRLMPWLRSWSMDLPLLTAVGRDSLFFYLWHPLLFGVWNLIGVPGWLMLVLSLLTILIAWAVIAEMPTFRGLFGVRAPDRAAAGGMGPAYAPPAAGTV